MSLADPNAVPAAPVPVPYETAYDVRRGYEILPPAPVVAPPAAAEARAARSGRAARLRRA